jgi:hypothetical protein
MFAKKNWQQQLWGWKVCPDLSAQPCTVLLIDSVAAIQAVANEDSQDKKVIHISKI